MAPNPSKYLYIWYRYLENGLHVYRYSQRLKLVYIWVYVMLLFVYTSIYTYTHVLPEVVVVVVACTYSANIILFTYVPFQQHWVWHCSRYGYIEFILFAFGPCCCCFIMEKKMPTEKFWLFGLLFTDRSTTKFSQNIFFFINRLSKQIGLKNTLGYIWVGANRKVYIYTIS